MSIPPSKERDEETLKLMQFFFARLVEEEKPTPEERLQYLPEYFLRWLSGHVDLLDRDAVLADAGVAPVAWDFLHEILESPAGALMINTQWPRVLLAHRPDPAHPVQRLTLAMTVTWEDGVIFPAVVNLPAGLVEGGVMNDALVAAMVLQQVRQFMQPVIAEGLDACHDRYGGQHGGEEPFDVLMGTVLKVLPQLKPEIRPFVEKYMRLAQLLINAPLPPAVRARLEANRQRKEQHRRPEGNKTEVGGWDN